MSARMAKVVSGGKIVLPAVPRRAAGIETGDTVIVEATGEGELRIRTLSASIKRAQALVARTVPKSRSLASELVAERKKAAAIE